MNSIKKLLKLDVEGTISIEKINSTNLIVDCYNMLGTDMGYEMPIKKIPQLFLIYDDDYRNVPVENKLASKLTGTPIYGNVLIAKIPKNKKDFDFTNIINCTNKEVEKIKSYLG